MTHKIPFHSVDIVGLTDEDPAEWTNAVQYSVAMPDGRHLVYGDQRWVASGRALADHRDGWVERRTVTITYGEWEASP